MVHLQNGDDNTKQIFYTDIKKDQILTSEVYAPSPSINGFDTLTDDPISIELLVNQSSLQTVWGKVTKSNSPYVCSVNSWVVVIGNIGFDFSEKSEAQLMFKLFKHHIHIDLKTANDIYYRIIYQS